MSSIGGIHAGRTVLWTFISGNRYITAVTRDVFSLEEIFEAIETEDIPLEKPFALVSMLESTSRESDSDLNAIRARDLADVYIGV